MPYDPSIDFVGLWRSISTGVEKAEMPGLDFVVAALGRAGIINVVFSQLPPETNQTTTAWFRTANPSYAAEGALYLWDARIGAYAPATPELFMTFLMYFTNDDMIAIFAVTGTPTDDIGKNGDYAIRLDPPGGIYGPKAGSHWPIDPIPGTSYSQISAFLDWLGNIQGEIVYRGSTGWTVLQPGAAGQTLKTGGAGANPFWGSGSSSSADFDSMFGGIQGSVIYRGLSLWSSLAPGQNGYVLTTHGANANPTWSTLSNVIDINFGGVQGSILIRDASGWVALPPGTPGLALVTNGGGANPGWSGVAGTPGPAGPQGNPGPAGPQGPPGSSGIYDGRLTYAGHGLPDWTITGGPGTYEPFAGALVSGMRIYDDGGTGFVFDYRWRYVQLFSTGWYTVAYNG